MRLNAFHAFALLSLLISLVGVSGCSSEVSHTESDKPGWFGGRTHQETTVYQNPDGSTSVEHSKETTK